MYLTMMIFLLSWTLLMSFVKNIPMIEILFSGFIYLSMKIHFSFDFYKYEGYSFALDSMSLIMILLTFWIIIIIQMMNFTNKFYMIIMNMLLLILLEVFWTSNPLLFFVMFEVSLLPTLWIIVGWGIQPERLQATMYLMMYMLFFSFPFIISLMIMELTNMSFFNNYHDIPMNEQMFFLLMNMVFLTKLPMFFFHSWLPKAHLEAPPFGSMILASILLKMGGYGLIRFNSLFPTSMNMKNIFISISLLGMVITCLSCLTSMDMKQMIAYSSISHMNLLSASIFLFFCSSYSGALIMMISHGLTSSCMFFSMNIGYERIHSRSFLENKFFLSFFPLMGLLWAMLCVLNMGWPPSLSSMSEILIIYNLYNKYSYTYFLIILYLLFSAIYSMVLYSNCCHGKISWYKNPIIFYPLMMKEWLIIFLHLIPSFMLITFMYPMMFL